MGSGFFLFLFLFIHRLNMGLGILGGKGEADGGVLHGHQHGVSFSASANLAPGI